MALRHLPEYCSQPACSPCGTRAAYYYYQTVNGTGTLCNPSCKGSLIPPLPYDGTGYHVTMQKLIDYFGSISLPVGAVQCEYES